MEIHTSYFDNIERIKQEDPEQVFVSIAGYAPPRFTGHRMPELAPKKVWWTKWYERFKDNLDSIESISWYSAKYRDTVLSNLDQVEIVHRLSKLGDKVVLLCYETPDKFCHRHLVSEWIDSAYLKHGRESCEWMNSELVDLKCIDTLLRSIGLALVESKLSALWHPLDKRFAISFADPLRQCSSMTAATTGCSPHQLFDEMHLRECFKIYDADLVSSLVANPFVGMSYEEMMLRASIIDPNLVSSRVP